jgi:hypothetical protein
MKVRNLLGVLFPLVLSTGCYSHTAAMARRPVVVAPVSQSPEVRVYETPATPPPTAPPTAVVVSPATETVKTVPASDVDVAMGLRRELESDPALRAATTDTDIVVNGGAVTLRGSVPTEHDRVSLKQMISRYPGVRSVEDNLKVELR